MKTPPAPPWNLRGGALIFLQRASTRTEQRAAFAEVLPSLLPRVLALVHYAESPVGSYDERTVAVLTWRGPSVVEMPVNLELSRRGGRENWGYPKTLAPLAWREYSRKEKQEGTSSAFQADRAGSSQLRAQNAASTRSSDSLQQARENHDGFSENGAAENFSGSGAGLSPFFNRELSRAAWKRAQAPPMRIEFCAEDKTYRARVLALALPFVLHAFTIQQLDRRAVRVPIALRGKMRLAFYGKRAAIFAEFSMTVEAPRAL